MNKYIDNGGYIEAIGRRKTSVARVRISKLKKGFVVNSKDAKEYFDKSTDLKVINSPLFKNEEKYKELGVSVVVKGGGKSAQAVAIRHGLTRALVSFDEADRKIFKDFGYLTRDPRKKERKKFGLKKARKSPQWSKR